MSFWKPWPTSSGQIEPYTHQESEPMNRPKNRGLDYLRRSTDKQEISLGKQLEWAISAARQHGVTLNASPADLAHMQAFRLHSYQDIRLDDGITGSDLTRPG